MAGITPNLGFLQTPGAALPGVPNAALSGVPAVPAAPVTMASPSRALTALAQGATYEQLLAKGWTDATLVAHGLMTL